MRNTTRKRLHGWRSEPCQFHCSSTIKKQRGVVTCIVGTFLSLVLGGCGGGGGDTPAQQSKEPQTLEQTASMAAANPTVPLALSLKINASSLTADGSVDRFIIKYKDGTSERKSIAAVQSRLDKLGSALPATTRHVRRMGIGSDVVQTSRKLNTRDAKAFMRAIASDPDVEYVEPDAPLSASSAPNDPFYSLQWGLSSNEDPGQTDAGIRAENAWDITTGMGITIGLIDNGVTSHSDLNANILPQGRDFTYLDGPLDGSNPGIGRSCGVSYHGTLVAGVLAAVTNNGIGIAGIAPSAKIVSARALNECGTGLASAASDAIMWAAGGSVSGIPTNLHPVSVINASLSGPGQCSRAFQDAIDYAATRGAVVVAGASNNNADAANYQPANCRGVIAVGNTQRDGLRAGDSNFGPIVDIAAPGTDIYSTSNTGAKSLGMESYAYASGTSMSAPMVSGVIALIQSVAPTPLTVAEIRTLITQHAQSFPKKLDHPLGSGILDAAAAVTAAKAGEIPAAADFKCTQGAGGMIVTCSDRSTARGTTQISSWAWNLGFGDPNNIMRTQSVNPYYDYEYPGTYNITLTVTDSMGTSSTLTRPFTVTAPETTDLTANVPATFSANIRVMRYFALNVPSGAKSVTFTLSQKNYSDIGTLFLRAGSPTTRNAVCESTAVRGEPATCTIQDPAAGIYYGAVNPSTALSGATIRGTYAQ